MAFSPSPLQLIIFVVFGLSVAAIVFVVLYTVKAANSPTKYGSNSMPKGQNAKFCAKCGIALTPEQNFCPHCGLNQRTPK